MTAFTQSRISYSESTSVTSKYRSWVQCKASWHKMGGKKAACYSLRNNIQSSVENRVHFYDQINKLLKMLKTGSLLHECI